MGRWIGFLRPLCQRRTSMRCSRSFQHHRSSVAVEKHPKEETNMLCRYIRFRISFCCHLSGQWCLSRCSRIRLPTQDCHVWGSHRFVGKPQTCQQLVFGPLEKRMCRVRENLWNTSPKHEGWPRTPSVFLQDHISGNSSSNAQYNHPQI